MAEIEAKLREAKSALKEIGCNAESVTVKEFYEYLTGEIFSDDKTSLRDVPDNEFLMVHEFSEISELKKIGKTIDKRVIVDSPETVVYEAHFSAMELELKYAIFKRDNSRAKLRLKQHKESVLDNDPNLPETLRPRGEEIFAGSRAILKHN
jgi:hypothetical protein